MRQEGANRPPSPTVNTTRVSVDQHPKMPLTESKPIDILPALIPRRQARHLPNSFTNAACRSDEPGAQLRRGPCPSGQGPATFFGGCTMAGKKATTASGEEATGKEIRLPAVGTMKSFGSAIDAAAETIDDAKKDLSESREAAMKNALLPKPYQLAKNLRDAVKSAKNESIAAEKLAQFLAHFDHYRQFFKLDELANLQGRMFKTGPIGSGKPAAAEDAPRETDEDGEQDLRPRHLRQPGASAAEAVRELAERSGASTRPDEGNLDKLGRGREDDTTKH